MKKDLVVFLEDHLGEVESGWDGDGFSVVRFGNVPHDGAVTYATVGVNRLLGVDESSGERLSQEFVFVGSESFGEQNIPGVLMQVAEMVIGSGALLLPGEVVGPYGVMFDGTLMEAFYVTSPVYFSDEFFVCEEEDRGIVMAWLVPITADEAGFVEEHGAEAFEDLLEKVDPDLTDVYRKSIV